MTGWVPVGDVGDGDGDGYACERCGEVRTPKFIPVHDWWHQQIDEETETGRRWPGAPTTPPS